MATRRARSESRTPVRPVRRHTRKPRAGDAGQPAKGQTPPAEDTEKMAANLRQSLESTRLGLKSFVNSLRVSGMAEAVPGYRQLRTVLFQQRLWAESHGRIELVPYFQAVAELATAARSILAPFSDVMAGLEDLGRLTTSQIEPDSPSTTEPVP